MPATTELGAEVVHIGAHVKSLGAANREIDLRQGDAMDFITVHPHWSGFAFHLLTLAGEFVERHAIHFDGRNHRWNLFEIAKVAIENCADLFLAQIADRLFIDHLPFPVLRAGGLAKCQRALILLVLAHQQILDFGGATHHQDQQAGGHRIKGSAMADFFGVQGATRDGDNIV